MPDQNKNPADPGQASRKPNTGNASNPSPFSAETEPAGANQALGPKAEKYLRESANIEDVPDAQDQQDMDETVRKDRNDNNS